MEGGVELKSLNHLLVAGNFQQAKRGERDADRDRFGPGLLIQGECQVTLLACLWRRSFRAMHALFSISSACFL